MPRRLSVAVVQGGPSTEANVSRASASGIARALREGGHVVVQVELDAFLGESLRMGGYDVVFPAVHGAVGEDGSLQGLLEVLDLPYVGSGVLASALAMNKRVARRLFASTGLPVASGKSMGREEWRGDAHAAAVCAREVSASLVVKPSAQGSGIGVARLDASVSNEAVARAIAEVWAIDDFAIIERFVRGREITCGVLDVDGTVAFPPTEIVSPEDPFYTYEARYAPGRSIHRCPAELSATISARVKELAIAAHLAIECRDLSRADFVVGDAEGAPDAITLLEVNTLPGMTPTSLYPEAAHVYGMPMASLCDALVLHAHSRGALRRHPPRPLPKPG